MKKISKQSGRINLVPRPEGDEENGLKRVSSDLRGRRRASDSLNLIKSQSCISFLTASDRDTPSDISGLDRLSETSDRRQRSSFGQKTYHSYQVDVSETTGLAPESEPEQATEESEPLTEPDPEESPTVLAAREAAFQELAESLRYERPLCTGGGTGVLSGDELEFEVNRPKALHFPKLRLWSEVSTTKVDDTKQYLDSRYDGMGIKTDTTVDEERMEEMEYGEKFKFQTREMTEGTTVNPTAAVQVNMDDELLEEAEEEEEEEIEETKGDVEAEGDDEDLDDDENLRQAFTGFFNDNVRRVDMVIVVAENDEAEIEKIKTEFLANLIKLGLEMEFEHGRMRDHRHLIFIKVHAPDKVLVEYGGAFGVKKVFKDKHMEFTKPNATVLNSCFLLRQEREWLKLVRRLYIPPLKYSNIERSNIVYLLLLHQSFGERENHFGIRRLLDKSIILDVFALHDGPYFFTMTQKITNCNGRQVLYYNWIGLLNIFKFQPINMINEYFGSRVAFYFAFYEFYNKALVWPCLGGIIITLLQCLHGKYEFDILRKEVCTDDEVKSRYVCPQCRDFNACHFTKVESYCLNIQVQNYFDNKYMLMYCFLISFWAAFFIIFWVRKEKYWLWMWELCHPPQFPSIRPEFKSPYKHPKRSSRTGILKYYNGWLISIMRGIVLKLVVTSGLVAVLLVLTVTLLIKTNLAAYGILYYVPTKYNSYIYLAGTILPTQVCIWFTSVLFKKTALPLTKFENHRTQETFEKSFIIKVFGYSALGALTLIVYYGWLKGAMYTFPHYYNHPNFTLSLGSGTNVTFPVDFMGLYFTDNCGLFGCYFELITVYCVIIVFYILLLKLPRFFICHRKDYYNDKVDMGRYPCWEREYKLSSARDVDLIFKYNELAVQFCLITMFGVVFPLAPILCLLVNMWDIRVQAKKFVLHYRRPLVFRAFGIGAWTGVFAFICNASALVNAITIVRNSNLIAKYIYLKNVNNIDLHSFFSYGTTVFHTKDYNGTTAFKAFNDSKFFKPDKCVFQGLYDPRDSRHNLTMPWPFQWNNFTYLPGNFMPKIDKYHKNAFEVLFIIVFEALVVGCMLIMKYYVAPISKQVKEIIQMEVNLKKVHTQNQQKYQRYVDEQAVKEHMAKQKQEEADAE